MTMSPAARALLDAARDGLTPDAEALRRVRGKIGATAAAGAGAVAMKLTIVSVVALALAGVALPERTDVAAPALTFAPTVHHEQRAERVYEAPPPVVHVEPAHIEMPAQEASRVRSRIETARVESVRIETTRTEPTRTEPSRVIDLAREVELVDAAMASLRHGDATAALASVRLHRAETNNRGQLAEDAAAIEIEALCRLRDRRVVAKLEAFDARWPESAQRSRLTTSCP
jgi:hypothetical protein